MSVDANTRQAFEAAIEAEYIADIEAENALLREKLREVDAIAKAGLGQFAFRAVSRMTPKDLKGYYDIRNIISEALHPTV